MERSGILFDVYIGIDYSGADRPDKAIPGLAVVRAEGDGPPAVVAAPDHPHGWWSRRGLHDYLAAELAQRERRVFAGIDHGFSYPRGELAYYGLGTWDEFLDRLCAVWDTRRLSVADCLKRGAAYRNSGALRLAEAHYAIGASSVLDLDRRYGHPSKNVSYSTHAGIPWLAELRRSVDRDRLAFWPYDHIELRPDGGPVVNAPTGHIVAEVYPKICKERLGYKAAPPGERFGEALSGHQTDAFAVAEWAQRRDRAGALAAYFRLDTLTPGELRTAALEGWVLGCL